MATPDPSPFRIEASDAQLDDLMLDVLKPDFDPLDVPRDRFIVGGKAWQLCRCGQADPDAFGIFDMHGLGFVRGDLLVVAYAHSPNWAAARNGNDRYNFYVRRSFDGGQTWTTNPDGGGVYVCPEFRTDPNNPDLDPDGSGNLPPQVYFAVEDRVV